MSIRNNAEQIWLCPSTIWKILRKDFGLQPRKIQLVQKLNPNDHRLRRAFVDWAHNQLQIDLLFYRKILFTDEAHFWLNSYLNKQNCLIWKKSLPRRPILRPHCHRYGVRYPHMLNTFFFPKMQELNIDIAWFFYFKK